MNWYKKSQKLDLINNPDIQNINFNWNKQYKQGGWDRFLSRSGTPWKYVIEMNVGNPTEEEKQIIINKRLYDKEISPETIEILKIN